jgi:hypothetical protein
LPRARYSKLLDKVGLHLNERAKAQRQNQNSETTGDQPGSTMSNFPEINCVLVAPDNMAEGIARNQDIERTGQMIQLLR